MMFAKHRDNPFGPEAWKPKAGNPPVQAQPSAGPRPVAPPKLPGPARPHKGGRLARVLVTLAIIAALVGVRIAFKSQRRSTPPTPATLSTLDSVIRDAGSRNDRRRGRAMTRLALIDKADLTPEFTRTLLERAAQPQASQEWDLTCSALIHAGGRGPIDIVLPLIRQDFDAYTPSGRSAALSALSFTSDPSAARLYVELVLSHAGPDGLDDIPMWGFAASPHIAEILFPALLPLAKDPRYVDSISGSVLECARAGVIGPQDIAPIAAPVLARTRQTLEIVRFGSKESEDYWEAEYNSNVYLALLGYLHDEEGLRMLRDGLTLELPQARMAAALSLIRRREPLDPQLLHELAASPASRLPLLDGLKEAGRLELFPSQFHTQALIAESDLVNALFYDDEPEGIPEIELMETRRIDAGPPEGEVEIYLFRFRWTGDETTDWFAGVAGPYLLKEAPTADSRGQTSSDFENWGDMTPDEHLGDVHERIRLWREAAG